MRAKILTALTGLLISSCGYAPSVKHSNALCEERCGYYALEVSSEEGLIGVFDSKGDLVTLVDAWDGFPNSVSEIDFSPDKRYFATLYHSLDGSETQVSVFDTTNGELLFKEIVPGEHRYLNFQGDIITLGRIPCANPSAVYIDLEELFE